MTQPLPIQMMNDFDPSSGDIFGHGDPANDKAKLVTQKTAEQIRQIIKAAESHPMDRVVARYIRNECVDPDLAVIHARELKRFLALCAIYRGPIGMRGPVDELWHTFLMFTEDYQSFCDRIAGTFIHHVPHDDETTQEDRRTGALRFNSAYLACFGCEPDASIWPKLSEGREGTCMNGCGSRCGGCNCSVA
jgi:hypothetical protein